MGSNGFASPSSFLHFSREVRYHSRYFRNRSIDQFLKILSGQFEQRKILIEKGQFFWRAQRDSSLMPHFEDGHHVCDVPAPCEPSRMIPLSKRAEEGRANPRGIPYLYCTDQLETAIAEVRPWIGSLVSVGQFRIVRSLKLVSCSVSSKPQRIFVNGFPQVPRADWDNAVWWDIGRAFSKPVVPSDNTAEYVPTQIIAELCKKRKYDGLVYGSAFAGGCSLVLFDTDAAELVNCSLYEVAEIKFKSKRVGNPYFLSPNDSR